MMRLDDVLAMLLLATPGISEAEWRDRAAAASRFSAASQRTEQLKIATSILRPHEGVIPQDAFLEDLRTASRAQARDLIYARYIAAKPLARAAASAIAENVGHGNRFSVAELDALLLPLLQPLAPSSRARTRSAIISEFTRAGILGGTARDGLILTGSALDPLAFAHLLLDDLKVRREAPDTWIMRNSTPVVTFALTEERARTALESAIRAGRLRRSYFNGEPRILAP